MYFCASWGSSWSVLLEWLEIACSFCMVQCEPECVCECARLLFWQAPSHFVVELWLACVHGVGCLIMFADLLMG
jgi:hypothetical protein